MKWHLGTPATSTMCHTCPFTRHHRKEILGQLPSVSKMAFCRIATSARIVPQNIVLLPWLAQESWKRNNSRHTCRLVFMLLGCSTTHKHSAKHQGPLEFMPRAALGQLQGLHTHVVKSSYPTWNPTKTWEGIETEKHMLLLLLWVVSPACASHEKTS